jgi:hypothetical protein
MPATYFDPRNAPGLAAFSTTPYYDGYPMVLVRLDTVEVDELTELLTESWRLHAPAPMMEAFDADQRAR